MSVAASFSFSSSSSFTTLTDLTQLNDDDEKCDIIVSNPCYGVRFYPTDLVSLNSFAFNEDDDDADKLTIYDYDSSKSMAYNAHNFAKRLSDPKILRSASNSDIHIDPINVQYKKMKTFEQMKSEFKTSVCFTLHNECANGNTTSVIHLINDMSYDPMQPDQDKWYPIHHAAWNGHDEIVELLLKQFACSPNVFDNFLMTPMHYAALQGHVNVVKELLEHPDIDVICKNHEGKTALNMCEHNPKKDWLACTELIRAQLNKPPPQITIRLMDGSTWNLDLISGSNTTANQLSLQMFEKLELPKEYANVFTLWICSKNLQLQLKGDHKPMEHLADWKRCIIPQFTDVDPTKEEPSLFFKRDARLVLRNEKKVRHPWAIRLLCFEAYHNYINAMYPCSEHDACVLAAIFMEITNDGFDVKQWKSYLAEEKNLQLFIPSIKLRHKNRSYWSKLILKEYESQQATLANSNDIKLQYKFIVYCWNLTVYGSAFFQASYPTNKNKFQQIYVCVNDVGVHIVNRQTRMLEFSFSYNDIYWTVNLIPNVLEIKIRGSKQNSPDLVIHTKQCNLINHLMSRLQSQSYTSDTQ